VQIDAVNAVDFASAICKLGEKHEVFVAATAQCGTVIVLRRGSDGALKCAATKANPTAPSERWPLQRRH
jgi:hypothetical protein